MRSLELVTAPAREPLSLDYAKDLLHIDSTADDDVIQGLIGASRHFCEGFQNRAYLEQTWDLWLDDWPDEDYIQIPRPPLQSVTSVKYYDTDDTEYTLSSDDYFVDTASARGRVHLAYNDIWPSTTLRPAKAIAIRFTAGYETYSTTVTTDDTAVARGTSGDEFSTTWTAGKIVTIAGSTYRIASVTDADNLVLAATAGEQTDVAFTANDVPEHIIQAMILHMRTLHDDYEAKERKAMEEARDCLLKLDGVMLV
jgi:uncharacterized phiE125 gp8 family phage protein